jgi:hypothetical protein
MVPEVIATAARRRGWNREETRRKLMVEFPVLAVAEIDGVLDTVYGDQSGGRVECGIRRSERH